MHCTTLFIAKCRCCARGGRHCAHDQSPSINRHTTHTTHTDVAREAADIVLMDDQFPSIVNAIEEGRTIYDNLKKTVSVNYLNRQSFV